MIKPLFFVLFFAISTQALACGGAITKPHATLKGQVHKSSTCEFYFYGKKGQILQISLAKEDRPVAFLTSPVAKSLAGIERYRLPKSGRYVLSIALTAQDARSLESLESFTAQFILQDANGANNTITGRYQAILPCERCTGIDTLLTLQNDGSYTLKEKYLGLGANNNFFQQGKWFVRGNAIGLVPHEPIHADRYFIFDNNSLYLITTADMRKKNPPLRPEYRLRRQ